MLFLTILQGESPANADTLFASADARLIAIVRREIYNRMTCDPDPAVAQRRRKPAIPRSVAAQGTK